MFGRLAYEMVGQNVKMLMPENIAKIHDKKIDSYARVWREIGSPPSSRVVNPKRPRLVTAVRRLYNGLLQEFQIQLQVSFIRRTNRSMTRPPLYFLAFVTDVSAEYDLYKKLQIANDIQMKCAEAIVVADLDGQITYANPAAEEMFGVSRSFLLKYHKNVKWLMPKHIAEKHDGYLQDFRRNFLSNKTIQNSPIIGRSRRLMGRRPGDISDEHFPIVLRVEVVNNSLVAYIRDQTDFISRNEFDACLSERLFPPAITEDLVNCSSTHLCQALEDQSILITDIENFTQRSKTREVDEVYSWMNAMFIAFDDIIPTFSGEVVKRTGDGVIAIFGLSTLSQKDHAKRAVLTALAILSWCRKNCYNIRIGISSGDVGSGIFGDPHCRQQWDIWGSTVNEASRLESSCHVGQVQISEATYELLKHKYLRKLFEARVVPELKGIGTNVKTYITSLVSIEHISSLLAKQTILYQKEKEMLEEKQRELQEMLDLR